MLREVTERKRVCDVADCKGDYPSTCLGCGVDHCCSHAEKLGVKYSHGVYASGSGDGYYCKPCDSKVRDELHETYVIVAELRAEAERYGKDFKRRCDEAEKRARVAFDKHQPAAKPRP